MRFLLSLWTFVVTMVLALIGFTYTAINFPTTMRDLLAGAQQFAIRCSRLTLPDSYMVWVDIFLQPNQIVLVAFSIAMRIVLGLLISLFPGAGATGRSSAMFNARKPAAALQVSVRPVGLKGERGPQRRASRRQRAGRSSPHAAPSEPDPAAGRPAPLSTRRFWRNMRRSRMSRRSA